MIARFVNRQYRLVGPEERAAALDRLARSLARCDWRRCAYALMSNHIHLALLAGEASSSRLLKPLLTAMATCLNRAHSTFGPVFGGCATTIYMDAGRRAPLVAYLHNNPVRAGLAPSAADSTWTSHRIWVGLEPCPEWLALAQSLR